MGSLQLAPPGNTYYINVCVCVSCSAVSDSLQPNELALRMRWPKYWSFSASPVGSGGEKGLRGSGAGTLGVPLGGPRRVAGLLGVAGRLSGTVSPFRAEQGTSLDRRLRARGCATCQSLPQAELFVRQRERPRLPSQAVAWPPRLSPGRVFLSGEPHGQKSLVG